MNSSILPPELIINHTRHWLQSFVINLNLCPFAKRVQQNALIRYQVSFTDNTDQLLETLLDELEYLRATSEKKVETTLLVHPYVLSDFQAFNDFLHLIEEVLMQTELDLDFHIASFHPQYQFSDTEFKDLGNYTNRSPYPTLHLLRHTVLDRVLEKYTTSAEIPINNIRTLNELGEKHLLQLYHSIFAGEDR